MISNISNIIKPNCNLENLPLEVYKHILSFLSFPEIAKMQQLSRYHNRYLPIRYLEDEPSRMQDLIKIIFSRSMPLSQDWFDAFKKIAESCDNLDLSQISVNEKNISFVPQKIKRILEIFINIKKLNLCNPYINAEIVKRCTFSEALEDIELYFDPKYQSNHNWLGSLGNICSKLKLNYLAENAHRNRTHTLLPAPFNKLKSFAWKHNDKLPEFDYSDMKSLIDLKLCANSIEEAPLLAVTTLKTLTIDTLDSSSSDGLTKFKLENFPFLEVLRHKNLFFSESNLSTLVSLRKSCSNLTFDLNFVISDYSLFGLNNYCNDLVKNGLGREDCYSFLLKNTIIEDIENENLVSFLEKLTPQFVKKIHLLRLDLFVNKEIHDAVKKWPLSTLVLEQNINEDGYSLIHHLGTTLKALSISVNDKGKKFLEVTKNLTQIKDILIMNFLGHGLDVELLLWSLPSLYSLTFGNTSFTPRELRELPPNFQKLSIINTEAMPDIIDIPDFTFTYKKLKNSHLYTWQKIS